VTQLVITRGLPGSGKSTWARQWVSEDPAHRAEVNRDMLRLMMHGGYADAEVQVTAAAHASIAALLAQGVSVVCSDTNLPQRTARDLAKIATRAKAVLDVRDLTDVPLETCLARNAARADKEPVPEERIREMHARYVAGRKYPLPWPEEPATAAGALVPYEPKPGARKAVLVDIDGTVALKGARSPFDETRVREDRPNLPVITVVRALYDSGNEIVFLSGRTDGCRAATLEWLSEHVPVPRAGLFMRPAGDMRKDSVVKLELFDKHVRDAYDVTCVLDDRAQVVEAWRSIGLTCLAVAEGNF
jgi:predicted kinase